MKADLYRDVEAVMDYMDDLCEKAHKHGENVEVLRDAQKRVWNWYSEKRCPNLMYRDTQELIDERDDAA